MAHFIVGLQAIADVLNSRRISYQVQIDGKHAKIHFTVNSHPRRVVVSIFPNDRHRAYQDGRKVIRRILREEGMAV